MFVLTASVIVLRVVGLKIVSDEVESDIEL